VNVPDVGTDVDKAAGILHDGGLVALPTETVYGLAAAIDRPDALRRIFSVKGRPIDHPLIVHVVDVNQARTLCCEWPSPAERLSSTFWPGPLTLILRRSGAVPDEVTGGRDTVAIRCPSHPMAQSLLRLVRTPLAAPSANRFGRVSPTCAQHVVDDLDGDVDYVLDGDSSSIGVESTIVDCTVEPVQVLRPGAITADQIERVVGSAAPASGPSRASGMLESHYAPRCKIIAVESSEEGERLSAKPRHRLIDTRTSPDDAARRLYADLRRCDQEGVETAVIVLPEPLGIGLALRDRIMKAAAGA
jgi:L-threonylcarbamoyladenylate synthase